ncbi:hypothetical protein ACHAO9_006761 [Fusarium lateritium]
MKHTGAEDSLMALKTALANGLDPNVIERNSRTYDVNDRYLRRFRPAGTLLHWALEKLDFEIADCLLRNGAEIDLRNHKQLTALHEVILDENEEAVAYLLENGASPDEHYPDGVHPLCMALQITHVNIFRLLANAMSDLTTPFVDDWTIVDLALLAGDHQALGILFQRNPSLEPSPWTRAGFKDVPAGWTEPSKAKQLLAVCNSASLIPPSELYETYAHALPSRTETYSVESDAVDPALLIKGTFQALYDAAGIAVPVSRVTLCRSCSSFQDLVRLPGNSRRWFQLYQSRHELEECAKSCPFCRLVVDAFENAEDTTRKGLLTEGDEEDYCEGRPGGHELSLDKEMNKETDSIPVLEDMAVSAICLQLCHDEYYPLDPDQHTFVIAQDRQKRLVVKLPVEGIDELYLLDTNDSAGLDSSTESQQSFDIAARWLHQCRSSKYHEDCQKAYPDGGDILGPELPTRVLDLATFPSPRLVETSGTRSIYCALSYCWGDSGTNITTTRGNFSSHMKGIPLESLPVFTKEALIAARSLGYRYIWIDALCIIQDDPNDWDQEASKMKDVYANADLTLSSLVAKGCSEHLFYSRGSMTTRPVPFDIWTPKDKRPEWKQDVVYQHAVYPSFLINNDGDPQGFAGVDNLASKAPITSRGWVLQEQMLSTRILYFGSNYLLWECLCRTATDIDPCQVIKPRISGGLGLDTGKKYAVQGLAHPLSTEDPDDMEYQPFGIWQSLLTSYTKRRLTKSSDRVPAFFAISKALESTIGSEFIGGIWKGEKLMQSLCWNVRDADNSQPQAPSWSWASVNQIINFDCLLEGVTLAEPTSLATLVSFDVQTNHSQSDISGSITLKGTLHQKDIDISSKSKNTFFDCQAGVVGGCYALDLIGFDRELYDDDMENLDDEDMDCEEDCSPTVIVRLLLEPVDQTAGSDLPCVFKRIGICKDQGHWNQNLDDALLPRKDTNAEGTWHGINWSKANQVVTMV